MKKLIAVLCALMVMTFTAFAMGGGDSGKNAAADGETTVVFWSWLPTVIDWDPIYEAFKAENPDINIDYIRTEQSDYFQKLQVALASGTGPDLFGLQPGAYVQQYGMFCADMKALADKYMPGWTDTINATAVEQSSDADGYVTGMPVLLAGMPFMLYNDTLMKECGVTEVPKTYEEMKAASKKIIAAGYVPMAIGAADSWQSVDNFVAFCEQFEPGAVFEAEAGTRSWTDPVFVKAMEAWKAFFTDKIFEDGALGVVTYPDARDQYFFSRKAVFFPCGSWHVGPTSPSNAEIQGTEIQKRGDVIGMAAWPQVGPLPVAATTGVDFILSVNKTSKNQEAAMKFVDFITRGKGQELWTATGQGTPVVNGMSFTGKIDGKLQQESYDTIYKMNAASNARRKLLYAELDKALSVAGQNVASGSDIMKELQQVQAVSESIERP